MMLLQNKLSFFLVLMCISSIDCQHGQSTSHEQKPNDRRVSSRSALVGERSFGQQSIYDFTITQSLPSSSIPKQLGHDGQELQKRSDPGFPSQTSIFYASDDLATPAPQTIRQLPAPQNSDFGPTLPPKDFGQRDASSAPQDIPSPSSRQAPIHPPPDPTPPTSIISVSRSFFSRAPATFPPLPANAPTVRNAQDGPQQPQSPITTGSAEGSMTKAVFRGLNPQSGQPQTSNHPAGRNAFQEQNGQQPQFANDQSDSHQTFPSHSSSHGAGVPIDTRHTPNSVEAPQPIPHATISTATAGLVPPTAYSLGYPSTFLHSPEPLLHHPLYAPGYSLALTIPFGYGLPSHTEDILLPNSRSIQTISGSLLTA